MRARGEPTSLKGPLERQCATTLTWRCDGPHPSGIRDRVRAPLQNRVRVTTPLQITVRAPFPRLGLGTLYTFRVRVKPPWQDEF
jgi:hypothetical protein